MLKTVLICLVVSLLALPVFAQSVDTAWVRRYNGPGNYADIVSAMTIDGSGNVYVTGTSYGDGTYSDYATIKYFPNGDTAWLRRYNGAGNYVDIASATGVDGFGDVYVTGASYDSIGYPVYVTIKYYPNGDAAWVRRYSGQGNGSDYAYAIALDGSGYAYVTGRSGTIKYDAHGNEVWFGNWGGIDIAVDSSDNVFVTAGTGDYVTTKYNPNGDTAWVRTYGGPGHYLDSASALILDRSGNAYVTGSSYGGTTYKDYATIKYKPNGDTAWVRRYDGPASYYDEAFAMAVDNYDNVYVTGSSYTGIAASDDYATVKYYPDGDTAWVRRYNAQTYSIDAAYAIVVDGFGNVYVTGSAGGDCGTIKYYPNGDTAWVRRYDGPRNGGSAGNAVAVDDSGNVFVTGLSAGNGGYPDYVTIKYVQFLRGDANRDGGVNIADMVYLVGYLFKRGPQPNPIVQVGDANCDGKVTIADVVYLVAYLFKSGPTPCI